MANQKETLILAGSGHKGVVKLTATNERTVKGSCSLDFRPSGATLYLIGDMITPVQLVDVHTAFEAEFHASGEIGCVVRSSSLTMFGGGKSHSEMLAAIDKHLKQKATAPFSSKKEPPRTERVVESTSARVDVREGAPLTDWTKYDGSNFYYAIKPQLDEMFVCYPKHAELEKAVQNSKWVRVDADDGYYAVGLLFDGDEPNFICYAVPEKSGRRPPAEIENMCVWLPAATSEYLGYWVIYQSAKTGEIVK